MARDWTGVEIGGGGDEGEMGGGNNTEAGAETAETGAEPGVGEEEATSEGDDSGGASARL
ncbi:unnamed protein product [Clonostachys rosea f. rosea IK726]|uniref:Uncharacterized protein n=1 Tax=Clonostachys rosea f. rosea IK726 TaxID=1349383 RepID=A0ACA9UR84_BIOOC|nr:unnamed protein product [Clonostachys rosea f. rosea IK726]